MSVVRDTVDALNSFRAKRKYNHLVFKLVAMFAVLCHVTVTGIHLQSSDSTLPYHHILHTDPCDGRVASLLLVETLIREVARELDGTEVSDQAVMDN